MELLITKDHHGVRLDRFLRVHFPDQSLAAIYRLIRKGVVRVNGGRKQQQYRLQRGDRVRVPFAPPEREAFSLALTDREKALARESIVFEDGNILLCNKPPGLVMHRGSGHGYGLVEMIREVTGNPAFTFVNRIDKPTSGLVAGGVHPAAVRMLAELFRKGGVEKYYLILVEGRVDRDRFVLDSYLRKEETRVVEYAHALPGADRAVSECLVLARPEGATLLEARLHTGRTHQLRVQLAGIGHAIRGDGKYGAAGPVMHLFSRRLVIPSLDLDFSLPVPEWFPGV